MITSRRLAAILAEAGPVAPLHIDGSHTLIYRRMSIKSSGRDGI
jgi:hypothetical protein